MFLHEKNLFLIISLLVYHSFRFKDPYTVITKYYFIKFLYHRQNISLWKFKKRFYFNLKEFSSKFKDPLQKSIFYLLKEWFWTTISYNYLIKYFIMNIDSQTNLLTSSSHFLELWIQIFVILPCLDSLKY